MFSSSGVASTHIMNVRKLPLLLATLALSGCALGPRLDLPELTGAGPVELTPVELTHVPFHPQPEFHCGPSSLLSVLEASGVEPGFEAVAERIYLPELKGSLQTEVTAASRHFGRIPYLLPPRPEAVLDELYAGRPVLILQNLGVPSRPRWHYAVVVGADPGKNRFILRSGNESRLETRARAWLRQWDWAGRWAVVLLAPGELPAAPDRDRLVRAVTDFETTQGAAAARPAWSAVLDALPDEPLAWLGLGNAAWAESDWAGAERAYRALLERRPDYLPGRLNLALTLERQGRACEGMEILAGREPGADSPLAERFARATAELSESCPDA